MILPALQLGRDTGAVFFHGGPIFSTLFGIPTMTHAPFLTTADASRDGGIRLSCLVSLFGLTNAQLTQAYGWIRAYPKLLIMGALQGRPVDADPEDPVLVLAPAFKLAEIVKEER